MKTKILLFLTFFISIFSTNLFSQTYKTGFDDAAEQNGWTQYRVGVEDPFYEWEFITSEAHSAPNCIVHNYPVGGTEITDDWFVSPVFDFSEGGMIDSVWHRFSGFGLPMAGDTVAIYLLNGSQDPELATSMTMLFNYVDTSYMNDGIWTLNTEIMIPNTSGESYIGFRYKTIVNWLDVRFDDVSITSNNSTGIKDNILANSDITIFPNPSSDYINIRIDENLTIKTITLFDLKGKVLKSFNKNNKSFIINDLKSGFYLLKINTEEGTIAKKLLIK